MLQLNIFFGSLTRQLYFNHLISFNYLKYFENAHSSISSNYKNWSESSGAVRPA